MTSCALFLFAATKKCALPMLHKQGKVGFAVALFLLLQGHQSPGSDWSSALFFLFFL